MAEKNGSAVATNGHAAPAAVGGGPSIFIIGGGYV